MQLTPGARLQPALMISESVSVSWPDFNRSVTQTYSGEFAGRNWYLSGFWLPLLWCIEP